MAKSNETPWVFDSAFVDAEKLVEAETRLWLIARDNRFEEIAATDKAISGRSLVMDVIDPYFGTRKSDAIPKLITDLSFLKSPQAEAFAAAHPDRVAGFVQYAQQYVAVAEAQAALMKKTQEGIEIPYKATEDLPKLLIEVVDQLAEKGRFIGSATIINTAFKAANEAFNETDPQKVKVVNADLIVQTVLKENAISAAPQPEVAKKDSLDRGRVSPESMALMAKAVQQQREERNLYTATKPTPVEVVFVEGRAPILPAVGQLVAKTAIDAFMLPSTAGSAAYEAVTTALGYNVNAVEPAKPVDVVFVDGNKPDLSQAKAVAKGPAGPVLPAATDLLADTLHMINQRPQLKAVVQGMTGAVTDSMLGNGTAKLLNTNLVATGEHKLAAGKEADAEVDKTELKARENPAPEVAPEAALAATYVVKKGDSLSKLAMNEFAPLRESVKKALGNDKASELDVTLTLAAVVAGSNKVTNVDRINEGQTFTLPSDAEIAARVGKMKEKGGLLEDGHVNYAAEMQNKDGAVLANHFELAPSATPNGKAVASTGRSGPPA